MVSDGLVYCFDWMCLGVDWLSPRRRKYEYEIENENVWRIHIITSYTSLFVRATWRARAVETSMAWILKFVLVVNLVLIVQSKAPNCLRNVICIAWVRDRRLIVMFWPCKIAKKHSYAAAFVIKFVLVQQHIHNVDAFYVSFLADSWLLLIENFTSR